MKKERKNIGRWYNDFRHVCAEDFPSYKKALKAALSTADGFVIDGLYKVAIEINYDDYAKSWSYRVDADTSGDLFR